MSCIVDILCVFLIVYHQTSKQRSRCYINKELVAVGRIPSIFKELPVELRDEGQVTSSFVDQNEERNKTAHHHKQVDGRHADIQEIRTSQI